MQKNKGIIYAIFIAIIIVCGIIYSFIYNKNSKENINITVEDTIKEQTEEIESQEDIFIQLCGAVNKEGVYKVSIGTRIFEVVEMAGGLSSDAATNVVNQAREARDGELIFFPTKEEALNGKISNDISVYNDSSLININTASKEVLMTLPGIGEAKANSIIKFREKNNGFNDITEIMQVSGIKEAVYENIKDLITN